MHVLQQLMGHLNIATMRTFYIQVADASERDCFRLQQGRPCNGSQLRLTPD